jgi:hypothetical protein
VLAALVAGERPGQRAAHLDGVDFDLAVVHGREV